MNEKTLSEEELIQFARIGVQAMELKLEFARNTHLIALGEWAEKHGIPALKQLMDKEVGTFCPDHKPGCAVYHVKYPAKEALAALPKEEK